MGSEMCIRDRYSLVDPEGYIPPVLLVVMFSDITSKVLHRKKNRIGRGKEYLPHAEELGKSFANEGPTVGAGTTDAS